MRKKVIVFGGCGFIGSYLIEELHKRGHEVIAADLHSSKYVSSNFYRHCDIMDTKAIDNLVRGASVIFNFAGMASLDEATRNPVKAMELNVQGNLNILESCRKFHVDRFVFASSAYAMTNIGSFYGISKLTSEKLVEEYYKQYGLKFTIIRCGSVYGERDYENNYIFNLVKKAVLEKKICHQGDGEELREYIHAADVAKLASDIIEGNQYINEHLILTGVERMQRKQLFQMIDEMMGGEIKIELNNDGYDHHYKVTPYSFTPSRSKKLTANPFIDIGQGILDCIKIVNESQNE